MGDTEYIELDVKAIHETEPGESSVGAVLFFDGDKKFWVPKSLMEEWPEPGTEGTALIAEWFAEREGLI